MSDSSADDSGEFAARVIQGVQDALGNVAVETKKLISSGVSIYFRSPNERDPGIELIASGNWSYTLFYGKRLVAEDIPMDESRDDRVERVSGQIADLARHGVPKAGDFLARLAAEPGWAGRTP